MAELTKLRMVTTEMREESREDGEMTNEIEKGGGRRGRGVDEGREADDERGDSERD